MPTNTERRMLPLHSLLNPASPGHPVASFRKPDPTLVASPSASTADASPVAKAKSSGNVSNMAKPKLQGPVNFAPFEDVDQVSYRELCRFRVSPFGQIRQSCEHIPYNSSKKDFFEKTGRESIEGTASPPLNEGTKRLFLLWQCAEQGLRCSFQIRVPFARRRRNLYCHVGLQRRPCSHDSLL